MWKSAIARAKRIGDHGRKSVPIVKVEAGHKFLNLEKDGDKASESEDDEGSNHVYSEPVLNTTETITVAYEPAIPDTQSSIFNEIGSTEVGVKKSLKRAVSAGKQAAANARKKLALTRKQNK